MESISTYIKSVNHLKKIRKYLNQPDLKKITINYALLDSESVGGIRQVMYHTVMNLNDPKISKEFYGESFTIDFEKFFSSDYDLRIAFKDSLIEYCTKRIGRIGTIIGSDTTTAY